MKKKNFMTTIALMGLFTTAFAQITDVYVGGQSTDNKAVVWKNGTPTYLTTGDGSIYSVVVADNAVYAAGYEGNWGSRVAKVWKDGEVLFTLSDGTSNACAFFLAVSNSNVYVAGYDGEEGKVWQNDIIQSDYGNATTVYSIFIDGSDIYTAGSNSDGNAAVWKNGTVLYALTLGGGYSCAYSVVISDGDVYTAGYEDIGENIYVPKVWKNNDELYMLGTGSYSPDNISITVSGDVVYVAGADRIGNIPYANIWTNGVASKISKESWTWVNSIFVKGSDVYAAGTRDGEKAYYWKNSEQFTLVKGSLANSIFVVSDDESSVKAPTTDHSIVSGYYNLMGIKLSQEPAKGIYIKVYDNGMAKKVIK